MAEPNRIVIVGAGRIGRSFIGQIFGLAGYQVVFVDIDRVLVDNLNRRNSYSVVTRTEKDELIIVPNVRAVHSLDADRVAEEISGASLMAVSVGKEALNLVIPLIAGGIKKRYEKDPNLPLDIIIAENMRDGAVLMERLLIPHLPADYPMERLLGLVETSIGKMVPIQTESQLLEDPLMVFAEAYNELIMDGTAFKNGVPDAKGLAPKSNIRAWVDRKAFIHNLGHATTAYVGAFYHPRATCIYEVLQDKKVFEFSRDIMLQASEILQIRYPGEFSEAELGDHINDLLSRFQNRALGDTIFRVGCDLTRKLGQDDRFMGIIRVATEYGKDYDKILEALVYGLLFRGKDESGRMHPGDVIFAEGLSRSLDETLCTVCGLHPERDKQIIDRCKRQFEKLNSQINH